MFAFQHIEYLWGLFIILPLLLLFFSAIRWKATVKKALGDKALVDLLINNYAPKLYRLKFFLILMAVVATILAAANLRKPIEGNKEQSAGVDVMIAIDVSKSMLSTDIKPTRLERAKECVNLLVDKLGDNRVGLVLFAGQAFLQMPLTTDIVSSKMFISNAAPDAVPVQGTNLSGALKLCDFSLDEHQKKYKAVILISDGEDHDPAAEQTAKQLLDHGVLITTIGIGTAEGSPIIEPGSNAYKTNKNGQTVISKLNEPGLRSIAEITGGRYYHLNNVLETSNLVAAQLNNMDKKLIEGINGERQYASLFPLFIALAVLLLVAELFIPETKKIKS